jgi:hypothetical protein
MFEGDLADIKATSMIFVDVSIKVKKKTESRKHESSKARKSIKMKPDFVFLNFRAFVIRILKNDY